MIKKSAIHKIIILILIVLIGSGNPGIAKAQTLEGVAVLNEKSTAISNKYGITGQILKIFKDSYSTVVLTKDGIFYIHSGKTTKYTVEGTIMDTATFYKSGLNVYISPVLQMDSNNNKIYLEIKLNLDNGSQKVSTNYSEYMTKAKLMWVPDSIFTYTDAYNNKWFAAFYNFSTKHYELYRIDTAGNIRKMDSNDGSINSLSDHYKLRIDSSKNTYYSYSIGNGINVYGDGKGNVSKIISDIVRVDKNLKQKSFEIYGTVNDYEVGPAGDIWVLSGNKTLIHFDKNGIKLAAITLTNGKDISIEPGGSVYVLDNNAVKLVYKDKLYTKHTLNSAYLYHDLSMFSKGNLVASNENTYEMINGTGKEDIVSDAAVKYNPYVVTDNKGNITILSKNINTQKDTDLKVYQIGSSGISFHNVLKDLGDYTKAVGCDGTIYIPHIDKNSITINLLKSDMTTEKFATVQVYLPFIDMQMDSGNNLYILTNQDLIKISPSKKVQRIDFTQEKGGYNSSVWGFVKDKYNNLYIKYQKQDYTTIYNQYGLLDIKDILNVRPVEITPNDSTADLIFVTSRNEIAMINADAAQGNQMYILNSKGNPVKDSSYNGKSYYTPGLIDELARIWKTSDGTYFYDRYHWLYKKTASKEVSVENTEQVVGDAAGRLFYTDYSNVYIYDKQPPKVSYASPGIGQSKVSTLTKITLKLSEPVRKGADFNKVSLSLNGTRVTAACTLVDNKIIITPAARLKSGKKYQVTIPAKTVSDVAGNSLSGAYSFTFTTQ